MPFPAVPLDCNHPPMLDDVEIIATEIGLGNPVNIEQVGGQLMEKQGLSVLVQTFPAVFAKTVFKSLQRIALEKTEQPLVQHQILMKTAWLALRPGASDGGLGGCAGHGVNA